MARPRSSGEGSSSPLRADPWLDDDDIAARENLERLAGDAALAKDLREKNFEGPDYDRFQDVLIRYGVAVIRKWLIDGRLAAKCREKNILGIPTEAAFEFTADEADGLADEIVARGLEPFVEKSLRGARWDPRKGAAMKTYFVTGCLMKAGPVLDRWVRSERRIDAELTARPERFASTSIPPVESDVIADDALQRMLAPVKRRATRQAMVMATRGYKAHEIAEHLGMTTKAVQKAIEYGYTQIRRTRGA